jgi:hypothetical protein
MVVINTGTTLDCNFVQKKIVLTSNSQRELQGIEDRDANPESGRILPVLAERICNQIHKFIVPEGQFIVPDWGDLVNYDTGLSYRPASQCSLTGRYDNPMP